jgi:hypothetical protein
MNIQQAVEAAHHPFSSAIALISPRYGDVELPAHVATYAGQSCRTPTKEDE